MTKKLEAASRALERKEYERALELLLDAWRAEPGTALADLIDAVSKRASEGLPSLRRTPAAAQWALWRKVAARNKAVDFERLVDVPMPRKSVEAESLVRSLERQERDPRLSRFLCELLRSKTIYELSSDNRRGRIDGFHGRMRGLIIDQGDRRSLSFLDEQPQPLDGKRRAALRKKQPQLFDGEQLAELRKQPEPRGESLALVQSMLTGFARAPSPDKQVELGANAMLEQIYAHPEDLGLRAVYADLLITAGDPRGQFISLQLAGKPGAKKLLARHLKDWSGELDEYFLPVGRQFENGFLVGGKIDWTKLKRIDEERRFTARQLQSPAWRLITQLDFGSQVNPEPGILKRCPSLRSLVFHREDALGPLTKHRWPFTSLEFFLDDEKEHRLAQRMKKEAFPSLERIALVEHRIDRALAWLHRAPVFASCKEASVSGYVAPSRGWWKHLDRLPLQKFEVWAQGWKLDFERDPKGRLARVTGRSLRGTVEDLMKVVKDVPLSSFTLTAMSKNVTRKQVQAALGCPVHA